MTQGGPLAHGTAVAEQEGIALLENAAPATVTDVREMQRMEAENKLEMQRMEAEHKTKLPGTSPVCTSRVFDLCTCVIYTMYI